MAGEEQTMVGRVNHFVVRHPTANLADIMAEFDLSDVEAEQVLMEISNRTRWIMLHFNMATGKYDETPPWQQKASEQEGGGDGG